ncbi:hypothetical protein Dimus_012959, partial [Dionaea muscipula]
DAGMEEDVASRRRGAVAGDKGTTAGDRGATSGVKANVSGERVVAVGTGDASGGAAAGQLTGVIGEGKETTVGGRGNNPLDRCGDKDCGC